MSRDISEREPIIETIVRPRTKWTRFPCRYVLAILTFWGLSVAYSLRVNLSVALVAMVNSTYANANVESDVKESLECLHNQNYTTKFKVSL